MGGERSNLTSGGKLQGPTGKVGISEYNREPVGQLWEAERLRGFSGQLAFEELFRQLGL